MKKLYVSCISVAVFCFTYSLRCSSSAVEQPQKEPKPPYLVMVQEYTNQENEERGCCDFAMQVQPSLALSTNQALAGNTTSLVVPIPGTVTRPGQYVLVQNVELNSNTTGLFINANNVVIDLNDQTITGAATGNRGDGICITTGMSNITIRNGTIRNMGRDGIRLIPSPGGNVNRFIRLENLNIISCRNNGISISGGFDFFIANCFLSNNTNIGLAISSGTNITSQNFIIENCIASLNGSDGFQFNNCNNYLLRSVLSFSNGVNSTVLGNGILQLNGNRISFENCQTYSNGLAGIASSGNNHIFNSCQSDNNRTDGFTLTGNNCTLTNCTAIQNNARGFVISGNNTNLETCEAKSNGTNPPSAIQEATLAGFNITGNFHCLLANSAKSNIGSGILLNANSSQCQVRNNTLINNTFGIQNNGPVFPALNAHRIYTNFASNNTTANFTGVPNVTTSPAPATAINFTSNIAN